MFSLKATNITKTFSHKKALDGASLEIFSGQIHAVLGENGAGKSTLASIICGALVPDEGSIAIGNTPFPTQSLKIKEVYLKNPKEAQDKGIVMVHQRPLYSDSLTILENAVLGDSNTSSFFSKKKVKHRLTTILNDWNISLSVNKKGSELNAEESFYAELVSALYKNPKLLILDEPTALLPETERSIFFKNLKIHAEKGLAIIFITHNLEEAISYANFISVLKKGKLVLAKHNSIAKPIQVSELEEALFISYPQENKRKKRGASFYTSLLSQKNKIHLAVTKKVFSLNNLSFNGKQYPSLFNISFSVYEGAITYIYGQKASGIESLEEIITGIEKLPYTGSIFFGKKRYHTKRHLSPRILRKGGAALISTNKTFRSSNPNLSILEFLSIYKKVDKKAKDAERFSKSLIATEKMHIEITEPVSALSGGMLQRLILERELSTEPELLLFFEPAQGLDAQRLRQLANHLRSLSDMGKAILLVSANKENVFTEIADIQYEMRGGKLI